MVGRPSNRDERYEQVMQALVRCVARFGLEGASLSQIADEAGLTRPLIRHHLGNREELITALKDYVLKGFQEQSDALVAYIPAGSSGEYLIDLLFSNTEGDSPDLVLAFAALTARAAEDESLRQACRESVLRFEKAIADILCGCYPAASRQSAEVAAHGIVALFLNVASLASLDMPDEWKKTARVLARRLLEDLKNSPENATK